MKRKSKNLSKTICINEFGLISKKSFGWPMFGNAANIADEQDSDTDHHDGPGHCSNSQRLE